jgi:hypothetical protein
MTETSKCLRVRVYGRTYSEVVSKFSNLSKDVRKVVVPGGGPLLKMNLKSRWVSYRNDGPRFKQAEKSYQCIRKKHVLELKAMSDKVS